MNILKLAQVILNKNSHLIELIRKFSHFEVITLIFS